MLPKHTPFLLLLLFLLCAGFLFAQNKSITINTPVNPAGNIDKVARDYVELLPGFSFTPSAGNTFTARTDNTLVVQMTDADYVAAADLPAPDTRTLDYTLPVGTTPGAASVSLTGAATYQIPIYTPPGTAGMQPNISLVYSSQSGNGIAGWGWNIAGLSAITRVPKTIYHDGEVKGINLEGTDSYALDGNRLIPVSGYYWSCDWEYRTEVETFNKILQHGSNVCPSEFEVQSKNGLIMQYGVTADSRFLNENNTAVLAWKINQITDNYGNFITFTYKTVDREHVIDEINYTGNTSAGISPYNKIKFYYAKRMDTNIQYLAGSALKSNLLLRAVRVFADDNFTKEYQLKYAKTGLYSQLVEIMEQGSDASKLNATVFKYGDAGTDFQSSSPFGMTGDAFSGDYNGDGYTDMLSAAYAYNSNSQKYHTSYNLYMNDKSGNFSLKSSGTDLPKGEIYTNLNEGIQSNSFNTVNSDFNGDGKDDFLIPDIPIMGVYSKPYYLKTYIYLSDGTGFTPEYYDTPDGYEEVYAPNCYTVGDWDGDGATDFLTFTGLSTVKMCVYFPKTGTVITNVSGTDPAADFAYADKLLVVDFNGDGKNDIMVVKEWTTTIYSINKTGNTSVSFDILYGPTAYPTKWHTIIPGDFNGDGKTDLLTHNTDAELKLIWQIRYSTGSAFSSSDDFVFNNFVKWPADVKEQDKLTIGDFNGDGKSDILHVSKGIISIFNIYYSSGKGSFKHQQNIFNGGMGQNPLIVGDYNGDGNTDAVNIAAQLLGTAFYFNKNSKNLLLEKIADGLNNKTLFTYKPLTEGGTFYTQGSSSGNVDNVINFQGPLYAVSSLTVSDGAGGSTTTSYTYEGAKIHKTGKGFLGFLSTTATNSTTNRKIITANDFLKYYNPALYTTGVETKTASNNELLSSVTYTVDYTDFSTGHKRYFAPAKTIYSSDKTTGFNTYQVLTYDLSNGNLTQNQTAALGSKNETTTIQYFDYVNKGSWLPNRFESMQITKSRTGETDYTVRNTYTYNDKGKLTKETQFDDISPATYTKKLITEYTYGPFTGILKKTTLSTNQTGMASRENTFTYDTKGRFVMTATNPASQVTNYEYDTRWGKPTKITSHNGLVTTNTYDGFGQLTNTTAPDGNTTNYTSQLVQPNTVKYANGNDIGGIAYSATVTRNGSPSTTTWYDIAGRARKTQTDGFSGSVFTEQHFNNKGQLEYTSLPYFDGVTTPDKTSYTYYNDGSVNDGQLNTVVGTAGTTTYTYTKNTDGLKTSITTPDGQTTHKTADASGKLVQATDNGGTLTYTYFSHGQTKEIKMGPQGSQVSLASMQYDEYGRQTELTDANAGTTKYEYNAYGELTFQEDAKGNKYENMLYDKLGRLTSKKGTEGTYIWSYVTSGNGMNQLQTATAPNGTSQSFTYDWLGRTTQFTEKIDGQNYITKYEYDQYSHLSKTTYPSGFEVKNSYDDTKGFLTGMYNDNNTFYTPQQYNALGQIKQYKFSNNNTVASFTYDANHRPAQWEIGNWKYALSFEGTTGNLTSRQQTSTPALTETFAHDVLNRLTSHQVTGKSPGYIGYNDNGNIDFHSNSKISLTYSPTKPNAVKTVEDQSGVIIANQQDITYTAFNKAKKITEGDYELTYIYGTDQQRKISELKKISIGATEKKIVYSGNYEKITVGSDVYEVSYIPSPQGLVIVNVKHNGTDNIYYIYTDHLGSLLTVTDASGNKVYEQNFDAWGRERNPSDWTPLSGGAGGGSKPAWLIRGFTGHEHLPEFALINMNGRMYDPVLGRMLSPDNYVQDATGTQAFNRYSYALNNPLKYTDPNGEFITWSINNNGLSIGVNFTPVDIPLGAGLNFGWGDGFSLGVYGEVGYRVGGTGLGSGVTVSQSLDYNFGNSTWSTTTSEGAYASYGPFNAGINFSQSYDITNDQWNNGWGVYAGVGIGSPKAGIGAFVGYGSGGWSYGIGGYYNPYVKRVMPNNLTASSSQDAPQSDGLTYLEGGDVKNSKYTWNYPGDSYDFDIYLSEDGQMIFDGNKEPDRINFSQDGRTIFKGDIGSDVGRQTYTYQSSRVGTYNLTVTRIGTQSNFKIYINQGAAFTYSYASYIRNISFRPRKW